MSRPRVNEDGVVVTALVLAFFATYAVAIFGFGSDRPPEPWGVPSRDSPDPPSLIDDDGRHRQSCNDE